jgi:hypothetical protein
MTREPFIVHCGGCDHEWAPCFLPVPLDTMAAMLARAACPVCGSQAVQIGPVVRETADGDALGWVLNGDTGTSSLTIWAVMMNREPGPRFHPDVPHDPADFGRCYRLLKVMPSWRARLGEVADRFPAWRPLVDHWAEIEALYLEELPSGMAPTCWALMRQLRGAR